MFSDDIPGLLLLIPHHAKSAFVFIESVAEAGEMESHIRFKSEGHPLGESSGSFCEIHDQYDHYDMLYIECYF